MEIYNVVLRKKIQDDLFKLPKHIITKLTAWINAVAHDGLSEVRKIPGYHDESLRGLEKDRGQSDYQRRIELFILLISQEKWK